MKLIGSRFSDDTDLAAAEVSIFGVEIVGDDAKFGDGVEIQNNGRSVVDTFLGVCSIHHETVRTHPAPIYRLSSVGLIAGYRRLVYAHSLRGVVAIA